jgi:uncharacterized membrane protein
MMKLPISLDLILHRVLTIGLALSLFAVSLGGLVFLWNYAYERVDDHVFRGEPIGLKNMASIVHAADSDHALALIQLGILILIITPILRVFSCIFLFIKEGDKVYVMLASIVFCILLFSLI